MRRHAHNAWQPACQIQLLPSEEHPKQARPPGRAKTTPLTAHAGALLQACVCTAQRCILCSASPPPLQPHHSACRTTANAGEQGMGGPRGRELPLTRQPTWHTLHYGPPAAPGPATSPGTQAKPCAVTQPLLIVPTHPQHACPAAHAITTGTGAASTAIAGRQPNRPSSNRPRVHGSHLKPCTSIGWARIHDQTPQQQRRRGAVSTHPPQSTAVKGAHAAAGHTHSRHTPRRAGPTTTLRTPTS